MSTMNLESTNNDSPEAYHQHLYKRVSENFIVPSHHHYQAEDGSLVVSDDDDDDAMMKSGTANLICGENAGVSPIPTSSVLQLATTNDRCLAKQRNSACRQISIDGQTEILNQNLVVPGNFRFAPQCSPSWEDLHAHSHENKDSTPLGHSQRHPYKPYEKPRTLTGTHVSQGMTVARNTIRESPRNDTVTHPRPLDESVRRESSMSRGKLAQESFTKRIISDDGEETFSHPHKTEPLILPQNSKKYFQESNVPVITSDTNTSLLYPHTSNIMNPSSSQFYHHAQHHHQQAPMMMMGSSTLDRIATDDAAMIEQPPFLAMRPRTRSIAIQRSRRSYGSNGYGGAAPLSPSDDEPNESMYDYATWRMYHRIVDHRKSQQQSRQRERSSNKSSGSMNHVMPQEDTPKSDRHSMMMMMPFPVDHSSSGSSSCSDDEIFDMEL